MIDIDKIEQRLQEVRPFNHLAWELIQEVKRLRENNEALLLTLSQEEKTIEERCVEVKRLKTLLNNISDLFEGGLCYSDEWWATDDCDEQEKLPLGGLKIADSGVHDWPNVHFCSKKVRELRRLLP